MNSFGGMYITGGSVNVNALAAGTELGAQTPGWTDIATAVCPNNGHGGVTPAASTGRLSLTPGKWLVLADLTVEGNYSSGQSGDALGVIIAALHKGGTLITGSKTKFQTITEGLPMHAHISQLVEIAQSTQDASTPTNYVSVYLYGVDASGNDVVVTEARLIAIRLDE
jgi:hypothetical protein